MDLVSQVIAKTGRSDDELALLVAEAGHNPAASVAAMVGIDTPELRVLLADRAFRERVSGFIARSALTPAAEQEIMNRMVADAQEAEEVRERVQAARFAFSQAEVLRGEKSQVEHTGAVEVRFSLDPAAVASEGFQAPDALMGVEGVRDDRFGKALPATHEFEILPAPAAPDGARVGVEEDPEGNEV